MKILALDLGDEWVGIALSDPLHISAKPYKTIALDTLAEFIKNIVDQEHITEIIIGNPITLKGNVSEQTNKVMAIKQQLTKLFPTLSFILWDERLSSKRAEMIKKAKTKEEKLYSHAIAAAFILQSYLDYLQFKKNDKQTID